MLGDPRIHLWNIGEREPFVGDEIHAFRYESLRAGDGHAIPFPRSVLQSEYYWRADTCRVQLLVQEGESPYSGVSYVMEINLTGYNMVIREHINQRMRQWVPTPSQFSRGPLGLAWSAITSISPLTQECHWTAPVTLLTILSVQQVGQQGHENPLDAQVEVTATTRRVYVRYNAILPMRADHESFSPGRRRHRAISRLNGQ
jgi:hypothetical protein